MSQAGIFELRVLSDRLDDIDPCVKMIMRWHKTVTHYRILKNEETNASSLRLYWESCEENFRLPFPMDAEATISFVKNWFKSLKDEDFPPEDSYADMEREGFIINSIFESHPSFYGVLSITAARTEYGK